MSPKTGLIVAACVVLVCRIAGASYALWPNPVEESATPASGSAPKPTPAPAPEPSAEKPQDAIKFMASESFGKLDDKAKKEYFDQVRKTSGGRGFGFRGRGADLTEEERERLRQNVRPLARKMMEERMDAYFELPKKEKAAYLDDIIDRMQAGREAREERRRERAEAAEANANTDSAPATTASRAPRRNGHGRRFTPERMKRRIETSEPEERARRIQFMKDLRERAKERGVDMWHGRRSRSR